MERWCHILQSIDEAISVFVSSLSTVTAELKHAVLRLTSLKLGKQTLKSAAFLEGHMTGRNTRECVMYRLISAFYLIIFEFTNLV